MHPQWYAKRPGQQAGRHHRVGDDPSVLDGGSARDYGLFLKRDVLLLSPDALVPKWLCSCFTQRFRDFEMWMSTLSRAVHVSQRLTQQFVLLEKKRCRILPHRATETVDRWECDVRENEQRFQKALDEDVKIGAILALAPPSAQNHCHLNSHILKSDAQLRMLFDCSIRTVSFKAHTTCESRSLRGSVHCLRTQVLNYLPKVVTKYCHFRTSAENPASGTSAMGFAIFFVLTHPFSRGCWILSVCQVRESLLLRVPDLHDDGLLDFDCDDQTNHILRRKCKTGCMPNFYK